MQSVSLCTYTYNDENLLLELLKSVATWSIQPAEILVVDDCSDRPVSADRFPLPCKVIRFDRHRGLRHAKHHGPSQAASEYILSIDCDTRVSADWLEKCLPHAARKDIGLVSGPLLQDAGNDLVSRYLKFFGDNHNLDADGEVDFAPGNARLVRSEVWREIGGLSGHDMEICEDRYLCAVMRKYGYKMYVERRAPVFHVRRLSRMAMVRRFFNWNHRAYSQALPAERDFPNHACFEFVLPFMQLACYVMELNEPVFIYFEFLNLVYSVAGLLEYGVRKLGYSKEIEESWRRAVAGYLSGHPALCGLLFEDVFPGRGRPSDAGAAGTDARWERSLSLLESFVGKAGVWDWMEKNGVAMIRREDASLRRDFSFHQEFEPA